MRCGVSSRIFFFFFFNDTATTEIYTLSLHDALPIYLAMRGACCRDGFPCAQMTQKSCEEAHGRFQSVGSTCHDLDGGICEACAPCHVKSPECSDQHPCESKLDRKSTRLNSSHLGISYAVFC